MLQVVSGIGVLQLVKVNQVRPEDEARLSEGTGGHGIPTNRAALAGAKTLGKCREVMQRPWVDGGRWMGKKNERRIWEQGWSSGEHLHAGQVAVGTEGRQGC